MSELKPCPVCKGKLKIRHECSGDGYTTYWAECVSMINEKDYCHYKTGSYGSKNQILRIINSRPIEDALKAENEALKARVAELEKENEELQSKLTDKVETYVKIAVEIIDKYGEKTYEGEYYEDSSVVEQLYDIPTTSELITKMAEIIFTLEQEKKNKQWDALPNFIKTEELEADNARMREAAELSLVKIEHALTNPKYSTILFELKLITEQALKGEG